MDDKIINFLSIDNEDIKVLPEVEEILESLPKGLGFEEFGALFSLSDKDFEIISPIVLFELEKSLNNRDEKLQLAQAINIMGYKIEDFAQSLDILAEELEKSFKDYSPEKRDFFKRVFAILLNALMDSEIIGKRLVQIPIELCHEDAKIPTYANKTDAGMDIYALEDIIINPGETVLVKTGLKVAIPVGYELQVRPKSGRALKTKMRIANSPGTIKVA